MVTHNLISTVTVGSGGAANIEFTSIPQTYTDLCLVYSTRAATTGSDGSARFNSDTGSNYSYRKLGGDGTTTSSDSGTSQTSLTRVGRVNPSAATANVFSSNSMYIPNYTSSNNKSVLIEGVSENNATGANIDVIAGLWSNSAAITSITLLIDGGGNFAEYSSASLYGIKNT